MTEEQPAPPEEEPTTYEVTVTTEVEVDFTDEELQMLRESQDADRDLLAIEMLYSQRSLEDIQPEEKLLSLQAEAHETSDN